VSDARGGLRLVVDGTRHVAGLVEALHGQVQRLAPPLRRRDWLDAELHGPQPADGLPAARGITGLHLSMSHDAGFATAFVVAESGESGVGARAATRGPDSTTGRDAGPVPRAGDEPRPGADA